ncbi:MAG: DUF4105 domain-containing protein [Muribaculaceae bacterium]|nr:DUF4105 domain-containing protein [Muribaculaceae bacterium]
MNKILLHIALISAMLGPIIIPATAANTEATDSNSHPIKVSLITYYPGNEIFEVFGHSEILISDSTGNFYINYGVFDFNSPGFLTRYIMGETDYLCAVMPPERDGGIKEGRKMVQQELNLTPEQAEHVWDKLSWNAMPENREYRYRHFSDNCSTRPRDVIESALGRELDYSKCNYIVGKTLREVMRHYTKNYPWEQFGIDLALGAACDTMIDARTQTFVPLFLMHAIDSATVAQNGKQVPLVSKTDIIAPGSDNGIVAPPTPWYITPLAIALIVLVITILITLRDWRREKLSRWFDTALFTIAGLSGCLIFFLEFISTHEATMPNYNILWINPLMLLLAILPWFKKAKKTLRLCHMVNIALIATMVVVWLSCLQAPNTAFIPLVAALLLRSIINLRKKSA